MTCLTRRSSGPLRVGDFVEAYDDEGYKCLAVVASIQDRMLSLDPVWRAFTAPGETRVVLAGAPPAMWADWKNRLTVALWPVAVAQPVQPSTGRTELTTA